MAPGRLAVSMILASALVCSTGWLFARVLAAPEFEPRARTIRVGYVSIDRSIESVDLDLDRREILDSRTFPRPPEEYAIPFYFAPIWVHPPSVYPAPAPAPELVPRVRRMPPDVPRPEERAPLGPGDFPEPAAVENLAVTL